MTSRLEIPDGSDFPVQNLPYGVAEHDGRTGVVVAIGNHVVDLSVLAAAGTFPEVPPGTFDRDSLDRFMALGRPVWKAVRSRLTDLLAGGDEPHRRNAVEAALVPMTDVTMRLPIRIGDYVDFYSSIHHATNVGRLFRPGSEPLLPNWRHLPVGYHGRSGTVVVDGTPIRRPSGQRLDPATGEPTYGPTRALDFELEIGFITGSGNVLGEPIQVDDAHRHIFGLVLVNDWSARDLQAWEYQPLGPFLGKSFATTISPWIVPLDALAPFRVPAPPQDPEPLPYLRPRRRLAFDIRLEVEIVPAGSSTGTVVTRTGFADMYWTMDQQLAHATSNGATTRPGDLFASGTVSGPTPDSLGCLLELTEAGRRPLRLADGTERRYLRDGDTVIMRGWCGHGSARIGFGSCRGTVESASTRP